MIITRKIQVFVSESDADTKKENIHTLYQWRALVRRAANTIVAHKFCQENIKDFVYIKDEIKEKFYIKDILKKGKGYSEQNTTYRVCSDILKGKVPADIYSCLNQAVANTYKETKKDIYIGKASLRTYKNNIPVPFSGKALSNIHWNEEDKRFYFVLFQIPFGCALGRDRSNNKVMIERCISGEYHICGSSIAIDDEKKKMFLYLTMDIPQQKVKIDKDKCLYAYLGVMNPIVCTTSVNANIYDKTIERNPIWEIGTADEFNHRRRQIQEAVKRCQIENRYSVGGKGRKRKTQAIERFKDKENNYVDTKMHLYSRLLVDYAVRYACGKIILMKQKEREKEAKEDNNKEQKANHEDFVLRNWSYYGLTEKIKYKANKYGIALVVE